jgi:hypothetical protein
MLWVTVKGGAVYDHIRAEHLVSAILKYGEHCIAEVWGQFISRFTLVNPRRIPESVNSILTVVVDAKIVGASFGAILGGWRRFRAVPVASASPSKEVK